MNQPVRMVSAMRLDDNAMSTFNNYIKSQPPIRILSAIHIDNEFLRAYTSSIKDFYLTKE